MKIAYLDIFYNHLESIIIIIKSTDAAMSAKLRKYVKSPIYGHILIVTNSNYNEQKCFTYELLQSESDQTK